MIKKKQILKIILRFWFLFEVYEISVSQRSIKGQCHMGVMSRMQSLACQIMFQRTVSATAKTYALSKEYVECKIVILGAESIWWSPGHISSQTYVRVTRSWEGFVTVKSDVDRSDSFKINACMAVSHEQDKDIFPGAAEEESSWFSAEAGSNKMLRLRVYGSRVIYDHNGSFFRQRPKQKAPSEDLANFEVLRDV